MSSLMSIAEAARRLPYSEAALRARIQRGALQSVRIGRYHFLTEQELKKKFGSLYQPSGSLLARRRSR